MKRGVKKGLVRIALLGAVAFGCVGCSPLLYKNYDTSLRPNDKKHELIYYHPSDTIGSKVVKTQVGLYGDEIYTFLRVKNKNNSYETFLDFDSDQVVDHYAIWGEDSVVPIKEFYDDEIPVFKQSEFEKYLENRNLLRRD